MLTLRLPNPWKFGSTPTTDTRAFGDANGVSAVIRLNGKTSALTFSELRPPKRPPEQAKPRCAEVVSERSPGERLLR